MKKTFTLIAALAISTITIAGGTTIIPEGNEETEAKVEEAVVMRDLQVGLDATVIEDQAFFNLKMLNESEDAVYSLVRYNADGSYTSIGILDAVPNTINQPILYSFNDDEAQDEDVEYVLLRIGFEVEEIGTWTYKADNGSFVNTDTMWAIDHE